MPPTDRLDAQSHAAAAGIKHERRGQKACRLGGYGVCMVPIFKHLTMRRPVKHVRAGTKHRTLQMESVDLCDLHLRRHTLHYSSVHFVSITVSPLTLQESPVHVVQSALHSQNCCGKPTTEKLSASRGQKVSFSGSRRTAVKLLCECEPCGGMRIRKMEDNAAVKRVFSCCFSSYLIRKLKFLSDYI